MRVGLALGVAGLGLSELPALAARAEVAGLDTLCAGEATYESFACCAAIATATTRVRVMSAITTWARPPLLTAIGAATLAELSLGRFTLGLGTMPAAWNRELYGIDPARPLARMREHVEVVRQVLGGSCDFDGEFYSVRGYRRAPGAVTVRVPVHLAATRPAMARLAGEIADGVIYNFIHSRRLLREVMGPALARAGRSVERGVMVRVHVDNDRSAARAAITRSLQPYLKVDYLREMLGDQEPDAIFGSPAECRRQLAEYEGLVDWVELAPSSGMSGQELAEAYERLIDTFAR